MIERWIPKNHTFVEARLWSPDMPLNNADICQWLSSHDMNFAFRSTLSGQVLIDIRRNGSDGTWMAVSPGTVLIRYEQGHWGTETLDEFLDAYDKERS